MNEEELWEVVDRLRAQSNYVPKVASREELLEHIGRLQREMEERIAEHAMKRFARERDTLNERILILVKKVTSLQEMNRQLRARTA